jgi:hypothetical protein
MQTSHCYHNGLKIILSRIWEVNKQMNQIHGFSFLVKMLHGKFPIIYTVQYRMAYHVALN